MEGSQDTVLRYSCCSELLGTGSSHCCSDDSRSRRCSRSCREEMGVGGGGKWRLERRRAGILNAHAVVRMVCEKRGEWVHGAASQAPCHSAGQ